MDLNSKYLSNLEDSEVRRGGFLYSKENTKYPDGFPKDKSLPIDDKIYRDVIRISFNELYHNLNLPFLILSTFILIIVLLTS